MNKQKLSKKRFAKLILIIYFILICFPASLYVIVRVPFVQNLIVQKATAYLSEELQTEVSIKKIEINFFLNVIIKELQINDHRNQELISIKQVKLHLKKIALKKQSLHFSTIALENPIFSLKHYKGEKNNNLQFIIDYFSSDTPDSDKDTAPWKINISNLRIDKGNFTYINENLYEQNQEGIDFNNLQIKNLTFYAQHVSIDDIISLNITHLALTEHSGFSLYSMSTKLSLSNKHLSCNELKLKTRKTNLNADIQFTYDDFSSFQHFIEKVYITAHFKKSTIHTADITAFAPSLIQKFLVAEIQGNISGTIHNLYADDLLVSTENMTEILLSCHLKGLPDINNTEFEVSLKSFVSGTKDLEQIILKTGLSKDIMNSIKHIEHFQMYGEFMGTIHSFQTNNVFNSTIGNFAMNMTFSTVAGVPKYKGTLLTSQLDIGKLLDNNLLGIISSDLFVQGTHFSPELMSMKAEGRINSISFNKYNYQNITLNAEITEQTFTGNVFVNDTNIRLIFNGEIHFADSLPRYHFESSIANANLTKLNFSRNDSLSYFSANIECNANGSNIDNFWGNVLLTDIAYSEGINSYTIPKLNIIQKENGIFGKKQISIESDIADGYIEGKYKLSEFSDVLQLFMSEYISNYKLDSTQTINPEIFDIQFAFTLKSFDIITDLFIPALKVSDKTKIEGRFHSNNNLLNIKIDAENITYNTIQLSECNINIETFLQKIYVAMQSNELLISENSFFEHISLSSVIHNDSIDYSLFWNNYKAVQNNSGDIKGSIVIADTNKIIAMFEQSEFTIEDNKWEIDKNNLIHFSKDAFSVSNLRIFKDKQQILIQDSRDLSADASLEIAFKNFDLINIAPLLEKTEFNISGIMQGSVFLKNIFSSPYFTTNILVSNFYLQNEFLGDLKIISEYDNINKFVFSDINITYSGPIGIIEPINIKGKFYHEKEENNIDYSVKLTNYNIKTLAPFLEDYISIIEGRATGVLAVKGSYKNPEVNGTIQFIRTVLRVHYLNSVFSFADEFHITENRIFTENFSLIDQRGNRSSVRVNITHNRFSDFQFDIRMNTVGDFQFMNTTARHNDLFYGNVIADGQVFITGKPDDITMNINAKTGRGTSFSIPIDESGYAHENKFITFVAPLDTKDKIQHKATSMQNDLKFRMNLDLQVTPDAEVQIIFDPTIGDIMRGRGEGNLKIQFDMSGDLTMFGDLNIVGGDYLFTLENVINKRFYIASGGSIKWQGDPYNATIDLTTYYPIRTGIYSLVSHIDPSEIYKQKIPVHLQLMLKNNLMTPDITFDIELPQSDENTKNLVKNALVSEQELNRQVFALLILNSFVPPDQIAFNTLSSQGIGTTSTELLSNQLSNWLSQISKDFDIGVKYRPGGEVTSDEVELIFSTQFFNDRIRVEGNVGFGGQQLQESGTQQEQQVLGDVNIEYRITPDGRISAKTFNRSNPIDIITQNAPYTQGIGIFYRRDFNRFGDLWRRKNGIVYSEN